MSDDLPLLDVESVRAGYGRIEVLHGVSLRVLPNTLVAIVGANGAGKTTLLHVLSRILPLRRGRIVFDGRDISRAPSHTVVRDGLAHVPEGRHVLPAMTVEENLQVACALRRGIDARTEIAATYERFGVLGQRRNVPAGSLSGGEQQMLAIARALVGHPRMLLLDEPSMGLAPKLVAQIFEIVSQERARGTAILLVEQNARQALALADYAYVLERGSVSLEGPGRELAGHDDVVRAYLGAHA